jgi:hypothetical protein
MAQEVSHQYVKVEEPGIEPRLLNLGFVVDKVTLGHVALRLLRFIPIRIIPSVLHTHSYIIGAM